MSMFCEILENNEDIKSCSINKKNNGEKDVKLVRIGLIFIWVKSVKDKKFKLQFEEMYKKLPKSLEFLMFFEIMIIGVIVMLK